MSGFNHKYFQTRKPLYFVLFGALAFSLSSWPGFSAENVGEVSLSSEVAQVIENQLNAGDTATVDDVRDTRLGTFGSATVTRKKGEEKYWDPVAQEHKTKTFDDWIINVSACKGGERCENSYSETLSDHISTTAPLSAVVQKVKQVFAQASKNYVDKEQARVKEEKLRKAKEERERACLDVKNSDDRLQCRQDKFAEIEDEKEASRYFKKYLRDDIQNMLSSNNSAQQLQGMKLLQDVSGSGKGGQFVAEELADLHQYGQLQMQATNLKKQYQTGLLALNNLNPKDPNRMQMIQGLSWINQRAQTAKNAADNYFGGRQDQLTREIFPSDSPFNAGLIGSDNSLMQAQLDSYLSDIIQNHQAMLAQNQAQMPWANNQATASTSPTAARAGVPSTGLNYQPQNPAAPAAQRPAGGQQSLSLAIPHYGSPVSGVRR